MPRSERASFGASAPLFAALGDEQRLAIVARLSEDGPLSIARLTEGAGISRQAITKHLAGLADAGLVRGTRDGRESVWEASGPSASRTPGVCSTASRRSGTTRSTGCGTTWRARGEPLRPTRRRGTVARLPR